MEDKIIAAFSWKKYRPENCWATSFLEKGFRKQNSHLSIAFLKIPPAPPLPFHALVSILPLTLTPRTRITALPRTGIPPPARATPVLTLGRRSMFF